MSIDHTTRNTAKSLFTGVSLHTGVESLTTIWTFPLQENLRTQIFVGTWNATIFRFIAIKNWLINLLTIKAFSLLNWLYSYSPSCLSSTFYAAIHLFRCTCVWVEKLFALKAISFFNFNPKTFFMMMPSMFRICEKFEILNSIICFNPILVMNNFIWKQFSSKKFGHNHPVFKSLRSSIKHWVFICIYRYVSFIQSSSSFPIVVL